MEARFQLWLHRRGLRPLSLTQLLTYRHRLSQHHSRDPVHLSLVKQTIGKQVAAMTDASKGPWRCGPCRRLVKAAIPYCPNCGGHWTAIADETYVHGQLIPFNAAVTFCVEQPIHSGNYSTSLVCGEASGAAVCESGADPSSAQGFSGSGWAAAGIEGHPGQDGKFRDEEDHHGPSQVHSCPWKGSQAAARAARSQVPAQGELGTAPERLSGRLAKANRGLRQAAGAVQYVDPTGDNRIACSSELYSAAQCKSCSRPQLGVPPGRSSCPAEHLDAAIVDAEEKKLREKTQDVLSKAAKAALPAAEVVDLVETPSPVTMRQRSVEPAGGQDTAMQSGTT